MQFTSGQLFGRVAKTCLARVTNHAYRSGSNDPEALASPLVLFRKFLIAWVVFTDASFEPASDGIGVAGFGGVLVCHMADQSASSLLSSKVIILNI